VRPAYDKNRKLFDRLVLAISESIQGIHVIKGFARHQEESARFAALNDNFRDQQFWIFRKISFFQPLIGLVAQINIVVMLGYGGYLVVMYERAPDTAAAALVGLSVGQLLVFAGLLQQFSNQVANITNLANSFQQSLTASQRVFEVLDAPVEIQSPPNATRMPVCRGKVQFDNVSFLYDPNDPPILSDLKFTVEPGQVAAILGETASGKSTLLSLIPRFFDPSSGRVLVDDIDIRTMDVTDLRRKIGVVFQESFLFSNTVSANIAFGYPGADQKMIEEAARIACAHEFIMKMPQGYKTILHEGGANLSGGQRQRLAIARALLMNPSILLLDDPTSAIDPETEKEIMQAIENAMEGRTTFIVAHRLSTLRRADRVIVLKRGRIVQAGTHDELMKTVGHYSMAANLQIPDQESLNLLKDSPSP
jgi:ATP-binding cassette, subfamily B, bacterial